jgi:simple sugar transport system ATP-binding protein
MPTDRAPRLQLDGICKRFGAVQANASVSFAVQPGEVLGLLGENGAGKTTLMNIVYGLYHADAGRIQLDGQPVTIRSPHQAIMHGVGMVHQHFMLVPTLTVAENVILGTRPLLARGALLTDRRAVEAEVAGVAAQYGLQVNPAARVSDLGVGEQQRVEIIKALYRRARLLILDEPTAVLTPQETTELFATLKKLAAAGLSIIFISHKLNEVMAVARRVIVLRDGQVVGERPISETNPNDLAELMVGRPVKLTVDKPPASAGRTALMIEHLTVRNDHRRTALQDISLRVAQGEILGLAGVEGNGQHELALTLAGLLHPTAGAIRLFDADLTGCTPRQILNLGVSHIPEDRHSMGLVLEFSVADNFVLNRYDAAPFTVNGWLKPRAIADYAARLVQAFDVRTPSVQKITAQLSGGNQQKIVLGRELDRNPVLLVAVQPTRGLDVGATEYIHQQLLEQRARGAAILLISTELEEVLALSDRIAVLYEGRLVGEVPGDRANTHKIGLMMAGIRPATDEAEKAPL